MKKTIQKTYSTAHMKFVKIMLTCGQSTFVPFIIYLSIDLFMLEKIKYEPQMFIC